MAGPLRLQQVFGVTSEVNPRSYVNRGGLDERLSYVTTTDRHIVIHGDSKQGKSWLRSKVLGPEACIVVQCGLNTTPESLFSEALGQLGIRAEIKRTAGNDLEGSLDFSGSGSVGAKIIATLGLTAKAGAKATRKNTTETQLVGQTPADLPWVAKVLEASGKRLVVEDFHYVSEGMRQQFAFMLKALGEYGVRPVVVGIWPQDHLLPYYNGDLDGRVEDIRLEWAPHELEAVLKQGSDALNVSFSPPLRDALVEDAYCNVGLLQRLAENLCLQENVMERVTGSPPYITVGEPLRRARASIAGQMKPRYEAFADNFVRGMRRLSEGLEVYRHLLQVLSTASDAELLSGVDSATLLQRLKSHGMSNIRQSDLTQALERVDRLQEKIGIRPVVLTYSRDSRRIFVVDRSFLFYRKYGDPNWPWDDESLGMTNDLADTEPLDVS